MKSKCIKKASFELSIELVKTSHSKMVFFFTFSRLKLLKVAGQLCNELFSLNLLEYFHENVTDNSISDVIDEISTTFDDTLYACSFQAKSSTCYQYFHEILTEEGKCFTFNLLSPEEIFRTKYLFNSLFFHFQHIQQNSDLIEIRVFFLCQC